MKKQVNFYKVIFITIGVVVTIAAALAILYKIFTKYFKVSIDCECNDEGCNGDCEECRFDCDFSDEGLFGNDPDAETAGDEPAADSAPDNGEPAPAAE